MEKFEKVIEDVMTKIGKEKTFIIDVSGLDNIDRNVIMDTIEDAGYNVDTSYGSDQLSATEV